LYLDTSVLVALYIPERRSSAVAAAVGAARQAISALCEVEFASAVARRSRERAISSADAARVLETFDAHVGEQRFERLPVVPHTFSEAARMLRAGTAPLAALDALHLAIVRGHTHTLLTADAQLARAAERFDLKVRLIR
jgi:predicted nucleic acid-binding protein